MKNYLTQSIKVIAVAFILGWGVSAVSAWTAPSVNPPATGTVTAPSGDTAKGVYASVNVTDFGQIKAGGFIVSGIDKYLVSPMSFFKKVLLPDEDTSVYIGGAGTTDPTFATAATFPNDRSIPLTINMASRPTTTAIKYLADADSCAGPTKIITDSSAFQFWNDGKSDNADILAKGVRLTGGNPAPGKILIAVDNAGRAVWATPRLASNGVDILFDTSESPVGSCNPTIVVQVPGCMNSAATNYNSNATVDDGSCVVDLCTNIAGTQTSVPAGMTKDTAGSTPGLCTTPSVDLCPNITGTQTSVPAGMTVNTLGNCVTYGWSAGAWSACANPALNDWKDYYASGPMSSVGQSCTTWLNSQTNMQNNGTQTRTPTCVDSAGLQSTLCDPATMPLTFQTCTIPVQVRVKITSDNLGTPTVNYTDPGQCLYAKLQNPTDPDPLANMFPLGCQVRTISQSVPSGHSPAASCYLLSFSGGPGYGFNAGNPGGWTATGSATWQLQIKKQ